jgi:hypothetical protein
MSTSNETISPKQKLETLVVGCFEIDELERIFFWTFGQRLNAAITPEKSGEGRVHKMFRWAENQGLAKDLVVALVASRPFRDDLREAARAAHPGVKLPTHPAARKVSSHTLVGMVLFAFTVFVVGVFGGGGFVVWYVGFGYGPVKKTEPRPPEQVLVVFPRPVVVGARAQQLDPNGNLLPFPPELEKATADVAGPGGPNHVLRVVIGPFKQGTPACRVEISPVVEAKPVTGKALLRDSSGKCTPVPIASAGQKLKIDRIDCPKDNTIEVIVGIPKQPGCVDEILDSVDHRNFLHVWVEPK